MDLILLKRKLLLVCFLRKTAPVLMSSKTFDIAAGSKSGQIKSNLELIRNSIFEFSKISDINFELQAKTVLFDLTRVLFLQWMKTSIMENKCIKCKCK